MKQTQEEQTQFNVTTVMVSVISRDVSQFCFRLAYRAAQTPSNVPTFRTAPTSRVKQTLDT